MNRCASTPWILLCATMLALSACGDDNNTSASGGLSAGSTSLAPTTSGDTGSSSGVTPTTSGASASATGTTGGTTEAVTSSATDGIKFDLPVSDVNVSCESKCGNTDWSYVWIANSGEHTISKINTRTLVEEGRYITRADQNGNPSRTSVSIDAKAVVVANRNGGVTKIWARPEYCTDKNGNGKIDTSTGKNDLLPFDQEECIAWFTPFDGATTQRPVAWTSGTYNPRTCEYEDQKVWTAASFGKNGNGDACGGADGIYVYRLNGDTGVVEDTIPMPDVPIGYFGAYGGAVNQDGDFWFVIYDVVPSHLVRVDAETLQYEKFVVPPGICPYGFTVDSKGRPWIGSFCQNSVRFDPMTQQWGNIAALGYGIQQDAEGRMWLADYQLPGVREIDPETLALGKAITLPSGSVKGVSIDFYGYVWVVDMSQSAFRVDPDTDQFLSYDGLNGPYTYSDMTGWGLSNVTFPQG